MHCLVGTAGLHTFIFLRSTGFYGVGWGQIIAKLSNSWSVL